MPTLQLVLKLTEFRSSHARKSGKNVKIVTTKGGKLSFFLLSLSYSRVYINILLITGVVVGVMIPTYGERRHIDV